MGVKGGLCEGARVGHYPIPIEGRRAPSERKRNGSTASSRACIA